MVVCVDFVDFGGCIVFGFVDLFVVLLLLIAMICGCLYLFVTWEIVCLLGDCLALWFKLVGGLFVMVFV